MLYYVAVVSGSTSDDYEVSFPDFPDIHASHPNLDTALSQAEITLFLHTNALRADDRKIPVPRSVDEILQDADGAANLREGAITVVPLLPSAPTVVPLLPSAPAMMLESAGAGALHRATASNPFLRYLDTARQY